jgi:hypothetical protein
MPACKRKALSSNPSAAKKRKKATNPKIHMEAQKTLNRQKRTVLEVSQHLISNYTTEP